MHIFTGAFVRKLSDRSDISLLWQFLATRKTKFGKFIKYFYRLQRSSQLSIDVKKSGNNIIINFLR